MQQQLDALLSKTLQDVKARDADAAAASQADATATASAALAAKDNATVNTVLLSSAVPGSMVQTADGTVWQGVPNTAQPNTFKIPAASSIVYDDGAPDPNAPPPAPTTTDGGATNPEAPPGATPAPAGST